MLIFTIPFFIMVVFCADLCYAQLKLPLTKQISVSSRRQRFLGGKEFGVANSENIVYKTSFLVGTSKQVLNLQLDTGQNILWFTGPSCSECQYWFNPYNCQASDTCNLQTGSSSADDYLLSDYSHIYGTKGTVQIQLQDGTLVSSSQPFLYVTKLDNIVDSTRYSQDGILGLGLLDPYNSNNQQTWVETLYSAGTISSNQFSLYFTNYNNITTFTSQLMLGSVDTTYFKTGAVTNTHTVTLTNSWSVASGRILLGTNVVGSTGYHIIFNSTSIYMSFPTDLFNKIKDVLMNQYNLQVTPASSANNGEFFDYCAVKYPTFSFEIPNAAGQTVVYTLEPEFYAWHMPGTKGCGAMISESPSDKIILGYGFMQKYLSTFTYGASPTVSLTESITQGAFMPIFDYPSLNESSFPIWAMIVIPIATVLFVVILVYVAYRYVKKNNLAKKNLSNNQSQNTAVYPIKE